MSKDKPDSTDPVADAPQPAPQLKRRLFIFRATAMLTGAAAVALGASGRASAQRSDRDPNDRRGRGKGVTDNDPNDPRGRGSDNDPNDRRGRGRGSGKTDNDPNDRRGRGKGSDSDPDDP